MATHKMHLEQARRKILLICVLALPIDSAVVITWAVKRRGRHGNIMASPCLDVATTLETATLPRTNAFCTGRLAIFANTEKNSTWHRARTDSLAPIATKHTQIDEENGECRQLLEYAYCSVSAGIIQHVLL